MLLQYYVLLEYQSSLFMIVMESNNEVTMKPPHNYNQCGKGFAFIVNLKDRFFKYFKLVELAIVYFERNLKDEPTFLPSFS